MADIVTLYGGVTPSRSLSSTAFDSAMDEFVPFLEGLPVDINTAISYLVAFVDIKWYDSTYKYNTLGAIRPDFCYGSDGLTYVCTGDNVQGEDPVGSVSGNWTAITLTADSIETPDSMPVGSIITMAIGTEPSGYMECDGSTVSRTTYADLYSAIGSMYGEGDGSTTFNLPDYRGEFLRGFDNSAGNDPDASSRTDRGDGTTGDNIGTGQTSQYKSHYHSLGSNVMTWNSGSSSKVEGSPDTDPRGVGTDSSTSSSGGNETRPRNKTVMYCIKY